MKFLFKLSVFVSAAIIFAIEYCAAMVIVLIVSHIFDISYSPYLWIAGIILYLLYSKYAELHDEIAESIFMAQVLGKIGIKSNKEDDTDES